MLSRRSEEFVPTQLDYLVLWILCIIGAVVVLRWSMQNLHHLTQTISRSFQTLEYSYLTEDKKVIQPKGFEENDS